MQSLSDQLLKAGLITEEQFARAKSGPKRGRKRPRRSGAVRRNAQNAGAALAGAQAGPQAEERRAKSGAVPRMLDLKDPGKLKICQAVEKHRLRDDTSGEVSFHFVLRNQRVGKMFVSQEVAKRLEAGELAIVEFGTAEDHAIVSAPAVSAIRAVDGDAVRFHNSQT